MLAGGGGVQSAPAKKVIADVYEPASFQVRRAKGDAEGNGDLLAVPHIMWGGHRKMQAEAGTQIKGPAPSVFMRRIGQVAVPPR